MIQRFVRPTLFLLLCCPLVLRVFGADAPDSAAKQELGGTVTNGAASTNAFHVTPGPADGRIAYVTARMLEQLHYSHQPFDHSVAKELLNRYIEALDPQHLHFIQADLDQFAPYRTNLDRLTINRRGFADVSPGCEIFNRFLERLAQRVAYVDDLLKTEKFTFDADERIVINRHELPYPKDLDEARKLWRERLRYEYLQEHLAKVEAKKKAATAKSDLAAADQPKLENKPKTESEEIVETLTHRYNRNLRAFKDWNNDDVLQMYLTTLARVYDPHSDYMGHAQLESFAIGMNLSLFGIGAELFSDDGYCTIRRLLPGGPAEKSKKIKEKDRIIAVAQGDQTPVDLIDMSLPKAVQLIRGPKGTEVRLTIEPAGQGASARRVLSLIRDEIKLEDQAAKAKLIELPNAAGNPTRFGIIDLPSFYAPFDVGQGRRQEMANLNDAGASTSTTADVARLINKLKQEHVAGIILDLRRNGGGSLEEAIRLTGLFIKEGPVVQVREPDGTVQVDNDPDPSVLYDGPLVVLTSRFSASASEILAGALQDYGRALIVGDSATHGKGTVQSVNQLSPYMHLPGLSTNDPGALKLTIKKFYRASGASTQLRGVTPDIVLPSIWNESKDVGENSLENPLPYDTIQSAKFEHLNLVEPYLPELRRKSDARVATDREFAYIREDIEQYKKIQADKTVSLNEAERLKEKDEIDARQKAREKERHQRKDPSEKVYELSLRQAMLPGLPSPVQKTNTALAKASNSKEGVSVGVSTNTASVTAPEVASTDSLTDDLVDEEKPAPIDVDMAESEHILVDYLAALSKSNVLAADRIKPE
jgi:carboxyl-terminal processing protease